MHVLSIDSRIKRLEEQGSNQNLTIEYEEVTNSLPLQIATAMQEYDDVLKQDKECSIKFVSIFTYLPLITITKIMFQVEYLTTVSGPHPKSNIYRILNKVFSNNLGIECSWLGQRNNIRICHLHIN